MRQSFLILLGAGALAACGPALPPPVPTDLAAVLTDTPQPAVDATGACWGSDTIPAVIETVTDQVLVSPERRAADGSLIAAATFRTDTRQRIVGDRAEVWFRVPCAAEMTVAFMATLQRALKARGFYPGAVTGLYDDTTAAAVRQFQAARGFDSDRLTLAAAQSLGVAITPME